MSGPLIERFQLSILPYVYYQLEESIDRFMPDAYAKFDERVELNMPDYLNTPGCNLQRYRLVGQEFDKFVNEAAKEFSGLDQKNFAKIVEFYLSERKKHLFDGQQMSAVSIGSKPYGELAQTFSKACDYPASISWSPVQEAIVECAILEYIKRHPAPLDTHSPAVVQ